MTIGQPAVNVNVTTVVLAVAFVGVAVSGGFGRGGLGSVFLSVQDGAVGGAGRAQQGEDPNCHSGMQTWGKDSAHYGGC